MKRKYQRTLPMNVPRYSLHCDHCKREFLSSRPDAQYHSASCREAARRSRVKVVEAERQAEQARKEAVAQAVAQANKKAKGKAHSRKRKTKSPRR